MRTFWLAGLGLIGLAGVAAAQAPPASSQAPLPRGVMGVPAAPTTFLGGNNIFNQDGSALMNDPTSATNGTGGQVPGRPAAPANSRGP
jgi:hypothetical protein